MADDDPRPDEASTLPSIGPSPERRIDAYRLLQKIGEGGMGEVWLAEQERPIRRRVALKLLKPGLSSSDILARFETERQALALMDHPAIAKVLDAGTAPDGRPYFVMEYVEGIPLTEHCDRHRLSVRQRLDLFIQVCEGVQHAHQKAIIHRDIKPSNLLVSVQEGRTTPKIIDFGVAKATSMRLTDRTLFTELGQIIGTPAYMSPEQADLTAQNIDTRSDIYSLGAVLYELLAGQPPFDPKDLWKAGFDEMRRILRETEPPRPSTRVTSVALKPEDLAGLRKTDVSGLLSQVRGDLDWITMKALEKDRARRYGSATEFASDIRRHLHHEPVVARPPSAAYRARKFIRRHRAGVATASVAVLALCAFSTVTAIQARRIAAERDRANQEARTLAEVTDFVIGLFRISDPSEARGRTVTAREILDAGAAKVHSDLRSQPALQARLEEVIGRVYLNLGQYRTASQLLEESVAQRRRLLGEDHRETLQAKAALAWLYTNDGRGGQAESLYHATLPAMQRTLGMGDRATLNAMNGLAVLYGYLGRRAESESLRLVTLTNQRQLLGPEHMEVLRSQNNLALIYSETARYARAESLFLLTADGQRRTLGEDHPETIRTLSNLAVVYMNQRQDAKAESLRLWTLAAYGRVLGEDHPERLRAKANLGDFYRELGRLADAERVLREVYEARTRAQGASHPATLLSRAGLASVYIDQGKLVEADRMLAPVIAMVRETPDAPLSLGRLFVVGEVARLHARAGRPDAKERLLEIIALSDRAEDIEGAAIWRFEYACFAAGSGRREEAMEYLTRAVHDGFHEDDFFRRSELTTLRGTPGFEALAARVRGSLAPAESAKR